MVSSKAHRFTIGCLTIATLLCASQTHSAEKHAHSASIYGPLGLNTVPSARMDPIGTITLGTSTLDPYLHGYLGIQIAEPLYINIRQSAEISDLSSDSDRLYPGVDVKLRLIKENESRPEIAIGLQSAIGHKRMAGEYIALSKRYKDFDFTAGLGWGRFGTVGHINNPLKGLHSHFGSARQLDGEMPNEISNWFTGDTAGFFGGIEYFTPLSGLSLKFDIGGDRYEAEHNTIGFKTPAPWSVGAAYSPADWVNLSIAALGTDKLMARANLKTNVRGWRDQNSRPRDKAELMPFRTKEAAPSKMEITARNDGVFMFNANSTSKTMHANLKIEQNRASPAQIGNAAIHMANHAGPTIEELAITPRVLGLRGPDIKILRSDLKKALIRKQGSAEEIWHNAQFIPKRGFSLKRESRLMEHEFEEDISVTWENRFSLAEEDTGTLYRTSLLLKSFKPRLFGLLDSGASLRLNLADNLHRIRKIRPISILPVRGDVDLFAQRKIAWDSVYSAFTHSFRSDLHLSLIGGYLEEMYFGGGGEILYRPFRSRWALGAEAWQAFKRDPLSDMNLGLNGDHILSGHIQGWYDLPRHDVTLKAGFGRYLAEDIGVSFEIGKQFKNGAQLEGYLTVTDQADFDLFGGTTHADHGIRLVLPLGGFKGMPEHGKIVNVFQPLGRDTGQSIQKPLSLYDLTEPFSYNHLATYWDQVTPE